ARVGQKREGRNASSLCIVRGNRLGCQSQVQETTAPQVPNIGPTAVPRFRRLHPPPPPRIPKTPSGALFLKTAPIPACLEPLWGGRNRAPGGAQRNPGAESGGETRRWRVVDGRSLPSAASAHRLTASIFRAGDDSCRRTSTG